MDKDCSSNIVSSCLSDGNIRKKVNKGSSNDGEEDEVKKVKKKGNEFLLKSISSCQGKVNHRKKNIKTAVMVERKMK